MDKIIIGSTALIKWFTDFNRTPKDLDYAVSDPIKFVTTGGVEYLYNPVLFRYTEYVEDGYLQPNALYTLKMSHLAGFNINWERHEWDATFLRRKGCKLIRPLFDELYAHWTIVHGANKRSDLKMSAEDFFDNAVGYPVNHDDLHEMLITHPHFKEQKEPTYKKILKDGEEVDVCMDKFATLTEEEKCNVVMEEVMVMAHERANGRDYRPAYSWMLKKFIISHAKLEEAVWILEHYPELVKPKFNYIQYLNERIEESAN